MLKPISDEVNQIGKMIMESQPALPDRDTQARRGQWWVRARRRPRTELFHPSDVQKNDRECQPDVRTLSNGRTHFIATSDQGKWEHHATDEWRGGPETRRGVRRAWDGIYGLS